MFMQQLKKMSNCLFVLLCIFIATLNASDDLIWKISIKPKGGGSVAYNISSPAQSGTLQESESLKLANGANIDLTFIPSNGYKISMILKNGTDIVSWLDASNHFQFGPVDNSHLILAIFEPLVPTGNYHMTFPSNPPSDMAPIADITGNYTGTVRERAYDVDVAVDEDGKSMAMGTVAGLASNETGQELVGTGSMKTFDNTPQVKSKTKFNGTLDNNPIKGAGTFIVPVKLYEGTPENTNLDLGADKQYFVEGTLSYSVVKDSIKFHDKLVPVKKVVSTEDVTKLQNGQQWALSLNITEELISTKKNKKAVFVQAVLQLPNNIITFDKVKVNYKPEKGMSFSLKKGTNADGMIDKKTKLKIKNLTMELQTDETWKITGGNVKYKILNQKGEGSILNFMISNG